MVGKYTVWNIWMCGIYGKYQRETHNRVLEHGRRCSRELYTFWEIALGMLQSPARDGVPAIEIPCDIVAQLPFKN